MNNLKFRDLLTAKEMAQCEIQSIDDGYDRMLNEPIVILNEHLRIFACDIYSANNVLNLQKLLMRYEESDHHMVETFVNLVYKKLSNPTTIEDYEQITKELKEEIKNLNETISTIKQGYIAKQVLIEMFKEKQREINKLKKENKKLKEHADWAKTITTMNY